MFIVPRIKLILQFAIQSVNQAVDSFDRVATQLVAGIEFLLNKHQVKIVNGKGELVACFDEDVCKTLHSSAKENVINIFTGSKVLAFGENNAFVK